MTEIIVINRIFSPEHHNNLLGISSEHFIFNLSFKIYSKWNKKF